MTRVSSVEYPARLVLMSGAPEIFSDFVYDNKLGLTCFLLKSDTLIPCFKRALKQLDCKEAARSDKKD